MKEYLTTEQLMELAIETARQMSFDEKAKVRAMLNHSLGMSKLDFSDGTLSLLLKQAIPITARTTFCWRLRARCPKNWTGNLKNTSLKLE